MGGGKGAVTIFQLVAEGSLAPTLPGGTSFVLDDAVLLQGLVAHWVSAYACHQSKRAKNAEAAEDYRRIKALDSHTDGRLHVV